MDSFVSQYQAWLNWATDNANVKEHLTDLLLVFSIVGCLISLLAGWLLNLTQKFLQTCCLLDTKYSPIFASLAFLILSLLMSMLNCYFNSLKIDHALDDSDKPNLLTVHLSLLTYIASQCLFFTPRSLILIVTTHENYSGRIMGINSLAGLLDNSIPSLITYINGPLHGDFTRYSLEFMEISFMASIFPILCLFYWLWQYFHQRININSDEERQEFLTEY